LDKLIGH